VKRAVGQAGSAAVKFLAGGLAVGAVIGAIYFYRRSSAHHGR
jgi:hypothetical protein